MPMRRDKRLQFERTDFHKVDNHLDRSPATVDKGLPDKTAKH